MNFEFIITLQNGSQLADACPEQSHKRLRDVARPRLLLISKVVNAIIGFSVKTEKTLVFFLVALGGGSNVRSGPTLPTSAASSVDSSGTGNGEAGSNLLTPEQLVKLISGVLNESLVQKIGGMFQFNILGENGGTWYLDLRSGHGQIYTEKPVDNPNVVLTMSADDMLQIFYGQTAAFDAYMQGTLKVDGDLRMAMSLESIVKMLKEKPVIPEKQVAQGPGVYIV